MLEQEYLSSAYDDAEKSDKKMQLYIRQAGRCACPRHEAAPLAAFSIDHITPRCIAKRLGWSHKQTNSLENLQLLLSKTCHPQKDASTPLRLAQLKYMEKGGTIRFGEHQLEVPQIKAKRGSERLLDLGSVVYEPTKQTPNNHQ